LVSGSKEFLEVGRSILGRFLLRNFLRLLTDEEVLAAEASSLIAECAMSGAPASTTQRIQTRGAEMISKIISVILVAALLHGSMAAQDQSPPQTVAKMQQVLRKAQEKDKAVKVILKKKIDNQTKFTGKVSEVADASFTMADQQTGKPMKVAYEDVRQVNQKGMSKGAKVALGIAIGVGAAIGVGLVACYSQGYCRD
jgi:hypothetical protein